MENITALGQKFVPEVIVVEESPQSQEPGSSLAPPKDLVIRDFPSCQHTAFAVILQWELVLLCHEVRPCPVEVLDACLDVKIRHSDERVRLSECQRQTVQFRNEQVDICNGTVD
jgi:hypothetical protein